MTAVALITLLVSLLALGSFIWLVVIAFKQRVLWGVLVLLLSPIAAVVFGITCWRAAKKPFLAYLVSLVAGVGAAGYAFVALGGSQMVDVAQRVEQGQYSEQEAMAFIEQTMGDMEDSGMLSDEDQRELDRMQEMFEEIKQGSESPAIGHYEENEPPEDITATEEVEPEPETAAVRYAYRDVDVAELVPYVRNPVKVTTRDGRQHQAILLSMNADRITLQKKISGGKFDFEILTSKIARIQVLAPES